MNINDFLVKHLKVSGKTAFSLIAEKRIFINGIKATQRQFVTESNRIVFDNKTLQEGQEYFYLAYYKPRGIECTLNTSISGNLVDALPQWTGFFPVGRLDKDSEGLLLLTNDGNLYNQIAPSTAEKEKEYIVTVDKIITQESLQLLSEGVVIMGKKTRPATVTSINDFSFNIVLTQGLNRQIRRMCHKLGYKVITLKRIRIDSLLLDGLNPGEYRVVQKENIL